MRDRLKRQQLNNKGFSLVELIVIMIIVVILATAVVVAFVNNEDQKTKSSATLVSKYLDNVLNYSMTKGNAYLTIRYDEPSDRYYVEDSEGHSERLASAVRVSYDIENGEKGIAIDESNDRIMISFMRNNGSYTPLIKSVNPDGTFEYYTTGDSNSNMYADNIYIKCNDSTKVIHLYTKTGVYEIE